MAVCALNVSDMSVEKLPTKWQSGSDSDTNDSWTITSQLIADDRPQDAVSVANAFKAIPAASTIADQVAALIDAKGLEDTFYVFNLGVVKELKEHWDSRLPRVKPYYAVKSCPDRAVISMLAACGAGFDCASQQEIELVRSCCATSDIMFAHPCKSPAHIRFAAHAGINLTTFDSLCELEKIARWHPTSDVVLRIRADDVTARCKLGNKFGCEAEEVIPLLDAAARLRLNLCGVSFHIGSGAGNPAAFASAISAARQVSDAAISRGFDMRILDLGGGFSGGKLGAAEGPLGTAVPASINAALDAHFPASTGVRVIAEPGRYFAEAAATLVCAVTGVRSRQAEGKETRSYIISDGVYGAMNCIQRDYATVTPVPLLRSSPSSCSEACSSTVFGPTCDGADIVVQQCVLPLLTPGVDWVMFERMGAYTLAGSCDFNGLLATQAPCFYVV